MCAFLLTPNGGGWNFSRRCHLEQTLPVTVTWSPDAAAAESCKDLGVIWLTWHCLRASLSWIACCPSSDSECHPSWPSHHSAGVLPSATVLRLWGDLLRFLLLRLTGGSSCSGPSHRFTSCTGGKLSASDWLDQYEETWEGVMGPEPQLFKGIESWGGWECWRGSGVILGDLAWPVSESSGGTLS